MKPQPEDQSESDFPPGLARPARRALLGAGYTHIEQLAQVSADEIMKLHGIGGKAIRQLRQALDEKGLAFTDEST